MPSLWRPRRSPWVPQKSVLTLLSQGKPRALGCSVCTMELYYVICWMTWKTHSSSAGKLNTNEQPVPTIGYIYLLYTNRSNISRYSEMLPIGCSIICSLESSFKLQHAFSEFCFDTYLCILIGYHYSVAKMWAPLSYCTFELYWVCSIYTQPWLADTILIRTTL